MILFLVGTVILGTGATTVGICAVLDGDLELQYKAGFGLLGLGAFCNGVALLTVVF